jgi:uncharacterized phage infection (PIP) family protein YhgE
MAELEQTAAEALEKVRSLAALTDKAHGRLQDLAAEIEAAAGQVESEWTRFVEKGQALLERAGEVNERVGAEAAEARGAVATLQAALTQADGDLHGALDSARDNTLGLGRMLDDAVPDVEAMAESVEKASQELARNAEQVESALQQALEAGRTFVEDTVAEGLRELQEQVRERAQQLTAVMEECGRELQTSFDNWEAGLTEVETEVAEAFEETETHMAGLVETAVRLSREAYLDPLGEVAREVQELEQLLGEVAGAAGESEETAVGSAQETSGAMDEDRAALEAVKAKLDEVKTLLASFSFVEI